jgi:hypothetical protein
LNLFNDAPVDYNQQIRLKPDSANLSSRVFRSQDSHMTVLTALLHRSRFIVFAIVILSLSAATAIGQISIHAETNVGSLNETFGVQDISVNEESCAEKVWASLGTPPAGQTETHPKPHLTIPATPVVASTPAVVTETISSGPSPRFKAIERFQIPRSSDPYWRPLPPPRRFEPESDGEDDPDDDPQNGVSEKFHWRPAILQSIAIQGVQHLYAITVQEKTRRELKGPFFKDWFKSVRGLHGWDDGNRFFTNYVAHPMQGGLTGFIFVQNHDRLKKQKFAESKTYWVDRLKTLAWAAAWSTQWELGPMSQASIGNVGLKKGMAFVDLTITPTVGTWWMISEEAIDRYIIRHLEKKTNFVVKIFLRTLLNPMRSVANALRWKQPWYRDRPFGT